MSPPLLCQAQTVHDSKRRRRERRRHAGVAPEIIFFNGVIYTGDGFAEDKPETVQAMAIGGGKVLAVGTNDEIMRLAGPQTRIRDLKPAGKGVFVFPGFNDAHAHLGMAARTKLNVDLTGAKSLAAMLAKIASLCKDAPAGHWLTGGGWDHTLWAGKDAAHAAGTGPGDGRPSRVS